MDVHVSLFHEMEEMAESMEPYTKRCLSIALLPSTHPIPFFVTFRAVQVEGTEGGQATFLEALTQYL